MIKALILMKKYFFLIISVTFLFLTLSCSKDNIEEDTEKIKKAPTTFGIRHDKSKTDYITLAASNNGQLPSFEPIVAFEYSLDGSTNREFVATGTLISPTWVLTAGHNFFVSDEQTAPASINGIIVHTGNDPNNPTQTYKVKRLVFHPSWIQDDGLFTTANDLCLVELESAITSITPAVLYSSNNETIGSTVWFCGFGDYSSLAGQDPNAFSKKHAIENILDRKIDGITSKSNNTTYTGGLLAFDFDSPSGTINALGDALINADEAILGSGTSAPEATAYEGTTVEGDSGGPLFVKDADTWKLAGVLSGGATDPIANHKDSSYGDISMFIRVSTHNSWIISQIN